MNVFLANEISGGLTDEEKSILKSLTVPQLTAVVKDMDGSEIMKHFGFKPERAKTTQIKTLAIKLKNEKLLLKPMNEGVMSSVWQGKLDLKMVEQPTVNAKPTDAPKIELVIMKGQESTPTGTTPLLNKEKLPLFLHRTVVFVACFTEEKADVGIKSKVDARLAEKFPEFNLEGMVNIAHLLDDIRQLQKVAPASATGYAWMSRLIRLVNNMTHETQISFNHKVLELMKRVVIDHGKSQRPSAKIIEISEVVAPVIKVSVSVNNTPAVIAAWPAPINPNIRFSIPMNPKKGTESFSRHLMWAQDMVGLLGSSNIPQLSASAGLCPGLTPSESDVIRFVTVALAQYQKHGSIKLYGNYMQLIIFYYSLLEYLQKHKGQSMTTAVSVIKSTVCYSKIGLKTGTISVLNQKFACTDPKCFVGWCPQKFSSARTTAEVLENNKINYAVHYAEIGTIPDYAIFRQCFETEVGKHYFSDGFADLFNYWETNLSTLDAMQAKGDNKLYSVTPLIKVVKDIAEYSFDMAKAQLAFPFYPISKRSYRLLAVVGSKKLEAITESQILDFMGEDLAGEVDMSIAMQRAFGMASDVASGEDSSGEGESGEDGDSASNDYEDDEDPPEEEEKKVQVVPKKERGPKKERIEESARQGGTGKKKKKKEEEEVVPLSDSLF